MRLFIAAKRIFQNCKILYGYSAKKLKNRKENQKIGILKNSIFQKLKNLAERENRYVVYQLRK